jgi:hypothetical protein
MISQEEKILNIPTEDQLFEHPCQLKDMKLSAYNPKSLTYYCQTCGGKFIIEKEIHDWQKLFGEPMNLKLSKKVLTTVLKVREDHVRLEEEELDKKDEEARKRAEEARKKTELARKRKEKEIKQKLEHEAQLRSEEIKKEINKTAKKQKKTCKTKKKKR